MQIDKLRLNPPRLIDIRINVYIQESPTNNHIGWYRILYIKVFKKMKTCFILTCLHKYHICNSVKGEL